MRRVLVLVLLAGLFVSAEQAAYGCSCASGDPRSRLAASDAAFVGRLVEKEAVTPGPGGGYSSDQDVTYTFKVERSVKGDLGARVDVEAAAEGASCGIEAGVGERVGILLTRDGKLWRSSLCQQMDPDALINATKPLPAANGSGPVRFLVGGRFGGVRLVALDRHGKTLAYGKGDGHTSQLSVCPEARRVIEISYLTDDDGTFTPTLTVREITTLRVVSRRSLQNLAFSSPESRHIEGIRCLHPLGTDLYLFLTEYGEPRSSGTILRLGDAMKTVTVYEGDADSVLFVDEHTAYVTGGDHGADVLHIALPSGKTRRIATDTGGLARTLSLSPDGSRLVGVAGNWALEPDEAKLVLIDMREDPARVRKGVLGNRDLGGPTVWLGNDRIVVTPNDGTVRIYDDALKERNSLKGWAGNTIAIAGKTLYGCGWGWVGAAQLPNGPVRKIHTFDSPELFAFAVVPPPATTAEPTPEVAPTEASNPPQGAAEPEALPRSKTASVPLGRGLAKGGAGVMVLAVGVWWWMLVRRRGGATGLT